MIHSIPFEPEHLLEMSPRGIDNRYIECIPDPVSLGKRFKELGPAISLVHKGLIIASGGVVLISPGVGECWVWCNATISSHKFSLIRCARRFLNIVAEANNLHRLEAKVADYHYQSIRFMHLIGFHKEGTLKNFGPNKEDYYTFARLIE